MPLYGLTTTLELLFLLRPYAAIKSCVALLSAVSYRTTPLASNSKITEETASVRRSSLRAAVPKKQKRRGGASESARAPPPAGRRSPTRTGGGGGTTTTAHHQRQPIAHLIALVRHHDFCWAERTSAATREVCSNKEGRGQHYTLSRTTYPVYATNLLAILWLRMATVHYCFVPPLLDI